MSRLDALERELSGGPAVKRQDRLSIYACGSFGRLEASKVSDLDIFLIDIHEPSEQLISKTEQTLVTAELITAAAKLGFPEFSNNAEYLVFHQLSGALGHLGSQTDDFENFFTARLLLLLESRPVLFKEQYRAAVARVIDTYYRDYPDHETGFRPIFLINDIIRYWKTVCLNYEHKRNRTNVSEEAKNKSHLKNLKLKFSRLLSCFSLVIPLAAASHTRETLATLVLQTPLERLEMVSANEAAKRILERIVEDYVWFLEETGSLEILERIGDRGYRNRVFERGRTFAQTMYELLLEVVKDPVALRYLTM